MKTIEIDVTQAQLAQDVIKDNSFFIGIIQVFTNVFQLPKFELEEDELDYLDELEMCFSYHGVTEYNIL